MLHQQYKRLILIAILALATPGTARTEPCENTATFSAWLTDFRTEAAEAGISPKTLSTVFDGMTADPSTIARDRKQSFFWQDFLEFSDKLATPYRINLGRKKIEQHRALFDRVEKDYGVPAPAIAAFWALETDFGAVTGKTPVLRSLATLAWDCRRSEMFREELLAALRIIDRGDLKPATMIGSWAGELGQMQFLPGHYETYAVDYDDDGRRDLIRSTADAVASAAAYIRAFGWIRGAPWLEEVRVPAEMDWAEADLSITHPRSFWAGAGVRRADGTALDGGDVGASLLLPMGRNGPAFLAGPNFHVFTDWNQSLNYALTAAYLATRLAGAPAMRRGNGPVEAFGFERVRELQDLLNRNGHPLEKIDGKLGANSRAAVRAAQIRFGLPADAYPTPELVRQLKKLASD